MVQRDAAQVRDPAHHGPVQRGQRGCDDQRSIRGGAQQCGDVAAKLRIDLDEDAAVARVAQGRRGDPARLGGGELPDVEVHHDHGLRVVRN